MLTLSLLRQNVGKAYILIGALFMLLLFVIGHLAPKPPAEMGGGERLQAVDFEVFGKVQGVFFRKYTQRQAVELGVRGWIMNTSDGTVKGQLEGCEESVRKMLHWLEKTGSPKSRIEKAVFSEKKSIQEYTFKSFDIRK